MSCGAEGVIFSGGATYNLMVALLLTPGTEHADPQK